MFLDDLASAGLVGGQRREPEIVLVLCKG
jgi:hypothetical protein